jgi:hypothetical protein
MGYMKAKLCVVLLPFLMFSLAGGAEISAHIDIHLGKALPPPPPEVIVIEQAPQPGPPPWAPAHGARRKHSYYYYPGADVYFRPADRVWFYLDGREWRFGVSLPTNLRVDFARAVSVEMETDRPYQFHNEIRGHFPANYFGTKVQVKEKSGKPENREGDAPGKGKGRGRGNQ